MLVMHLFSAFFLGFTLLHTTFTDGKVLSDDDVCVVVTAAVAVLSL